MAWARLFRSQALDLALTRALRLPLKSHKDGRICVGTTVIVVLRRIPGEREPIGLAHIVTSLAAMGMA